MLTPQQAKLLRYIETVQRDGGVSPSFEDMRAHMGMKSKAGIHRLLEALTERGMIKRRKFHARCIEILKPQTHLNADYARGYRDGLAAQNLPAWDAGYRAGLAMANVDLDPSAATAKTGTDR